MFILALNYILHFNEISQIHLKIIENDIMNTCIPMTQLRNKTLCPAGVVQVVERLVHRRSNFLVRACNQLWA